MLSAATQPPANPPACAQLLTDGVMKPNANMMMAHCHICPVSIEEPTRRPYTMSAASNPKMLPEAPMVEVVLATFESTNPTTPARLKITNARAGP